MFTPTSRFPLIRAFLAVVVISLAFGDATNRRALAQTPNTSPADILDAAPQGLPPLPGKCAGPLGERDIDTIARYILSDPDRDSTLRACTEQISSDSARRITSRLNELGGMVSDQSTASPWSDAGFSLTESFEPASEQLGGMDDVRLAAPTYSKPLFIQPSTGKLVPDPRLDVGYTFNRNAEKATEDQAVEDLTSDTAPGDVSSTSDAADVPNALTATTTIMRETFEGEFPSGLWRISDGDGSTNGNYYWNDTSYRDSSYQPHGGNWSAWPAANALNPAQNYYANNMRSWMRYGPFDLRGATSAKLKFWYWNKSESNYDFFKWMASADGTNFYGVQTSGHSGGWRYIEFDLASVYSIGSVLGDGDVWIAFYFSSDGSSVDDGPFVDDVELSADRSQSTKKVVLDPGHGWCPGTPSANCVVDSGALANTMKEKDVTLDIAMRTRTLLQARGAVVYLTRSGNDPYHTLSYASQYVNQMNPDLSVSIHTNAGGGTGTEACYQYNKSTTQQSKDVSTRMTNAIAGNLSLTIRGIFSEYNTGRCGKGGQLYIHDMTPTAALIETAFIDNVSDAAKLSNRRQDFAKAIADAIAAYLGLP